MTAKNKQRQVQQQIRFGDDRQKSKSKSNRVGGLLPALHAVVHVGVAGGAERFVVHFLGAGGFF